MSYERGKEALDEILEDVRAALVSKEAFTRLKDKFLELCEQNWILQGQNSELLRRQNITEDQNLESSRRQKILEEKNATSQQDLKNLEGEMQELVQSLRAL
jgi:hypothetical protein